MNFLLFHTIFGSTYYLVKVNYFKTIFAVVKLPILFMFLIIVSLCFFNTIYYPIASVHFYIFSHMF